MNVGLGGDDLELETDKKGETSVGPRQAVVQVSIFLPKMDSRHVYRHIAFDIAFNVKVSEENQHWTQQRHDNAYNPNHMTTNST